MTVFFANTSGSKYSCHGWGISLLLGDPGLSKEILPEIRTTGDEFADVVSLKEMWYPIRFGYLATLNLVSLNTSLCL